MNCTILVLENRFFSSTDGKMGNTLFTIVPAGVYQLKAWHKRLPSPNAGGNRACLRRTQDGLHPRHHQPAEILIHGKLHHLKALDHTDKVLIPVAAVMSILLAATLWLVNRQIARELQNNAARQLLVAEAVFKNSEQIRANHLLLRYKSIADEPKFKALAKTR